MTTTVQHLFLIKTLNRVALEGSFIGLIKGMNENLLGWERKDQKDKDVCSRRLCSHCPGGSTQSSEAGKGNERHINWKEKIKLSLFADSMSLYIENPKEFTKLLELISVFNRGAGY